MSLSNLGDEGNAKVPPPGNSPQLNQTETNLRVALELAAEGILVFPALAKWNTKKQKLDKWPALKGWQGAATADPEQIKKWWQIFSAAIPGIELGRSDLFAVDLDRHPGGADGVAAFKAFRGNNHAPECPTVKTSSGGYHLYFRQPEREKLGNGTGSLPPGIDCRGEGGWTVAPGAVFGAWQWQRTGNSSRLSLAPHYQTTFSRPSEHGRAIRNPARVVRRAKPVSVNGPMRKPP